MNPDDLKGAWQAQAQARLAINPELLLQELRRNSDSFAVTILWRDIQEVGVGLIMIPVWFYLGPKFDLPWTWYLTVPALAWMIGYMLYDRMRHRSPDTSCEASLKQTACLSLRQVEHQIWLLRNVFWWYLLPPGVTVLAFFAHVGWLARSGGWKVGAFIAAAVLFEILVTWGLYQLNQYAVKNDLEPRRQELANLVASINGSETQEPSVEANKPSRAWITGICLLTLVISGLSALAFYLGS